MQKAFVVVVVVVVFFFFTGCIFHSCSNQRNAATQLLEYLEIIAHIMCEI